MIIPMVEKCENPDAFKYISLTFSNSWLRHSEVSGIYS